jgi:hypothetical protein
MTIIERNPSFAEDFAALLPKTPASVLRQIFGVDGDIYFTIQKIALRQPDGSTLFDKAVNVFTGPYAERNAREFVADPYEPRDPSPDYVTTIVLGTDGLWRESYQFRL